MKLKVKKSAVDSCTRGHGKRVLVVPVSLILSIDLWLLV